MRFFFDADKNGRAKVYTIYSLTNDDFALSLQRVSEIWDSHAPTYRTLVSTRNLTDRRNASIRTYTAAALRASPPRTFVDRSGQPFTDRIQRILRLLEPRLCRHRPLIRDEVVLTEILEEAGRLVVERELLVGPIEKLRGYAWVTIRNVKTSRFRRGSMRLEQATLDSGE